MHRYDFQLMKIKRNTVFSFWIIFFFLIADLGTIGTPPAWRWTNLSLLLHRYDFLLMKIKRNTVFSFWIMFFFLLQMWARLGPHLHEDGRISLCYCRKGEKYLTPLFLFGKIIPRNWPFTHPSDFCFLALWFLAFLRLFDSAIPVNLSRYRYLSNLVIL